MTHPQIIGLNGVARAGKDTVADVLHQIYGYEIKSYSEALNDALIALNPWVIESNEGWLRYADVIERLGYEKAKDDIPEVRALLQRMGTEVGRDMFGANIWVDALFKDRPLGAKWAIVNVRFPNEADAVWKRGGQVWDVIRPGFKPALGHISDTALDGIRKDEIIHNDGTKEDLAQKVISIMDPVQAAFR